MSELSTIYRRESIPGHKAQFRAMVIALGYLCKRYGPERYQRHYGRAIVAASRTMVR